MDEFLAPFWSAAACCRFGQSGSALARPERGSLLPPAQMPHYGFPSRKQASAAGVNACLLRESGSKLPHSKKEDHDTDSSVDGTRGKPGARKGSVRRWWKPAVPSVAPAATDPHPQRFSCGRPVGQSAGRARRAARHPDESPGPHSAFAGRAARCACRG